MKKSSKKVIIKKKIEKCLQCGKEVKEENEEKEVGSKGELFCDIICFEMYYRKNPPIYEEKIIIPLEKKAEIKKIEREIVKVSNDELKTKMNLLRNSERNESNRGNSNNIKSTGGFSSIIKRNIIIKPRVKVETKKEEPIFQKEKKVSSSEALTPKVKIKVLDKHIQKLLNEIHRRQYLLKIGRLAKNLKTKLSDWNIFVRDNYKKVVEEFKKENKPYERASIMPELSKRYKNFPKEEMNFDPEDDAQFQFDD